MQGVHGASPPTHRVRLLVADRRPIAASGLAAALEDAVDFTVEARCHTTRELATVLGAASTIEAVVVDAEMVDGDASHTLQAVRRLDPGAAVLLLTTRVDEPLLAAIAHECVSCVSAYSDADTIVSALRALVGGETDLPPEVQRALMEVLRHPPPPPPRADTRLTSREEQVLELAATGLTVFQIATRLHISHSTAKTHVLRVYEKLEAPNRSAAVAIAVGRGMLRVGTAAP
jgi:DNA-binding NarL/FixJ family response regulator